MAIVSTSFPHTIGLYHNQDGGQADWNVLIERFGVGVEVDSTDEIGHGDRVKIEISVGGVTRRVGELLTDKDSHFDWYTSGEEGTYSFFGNRDDDSSRIVAEHDATVYTGLPPGEGEWILRNVEFGSEAVLHREPVTVVPRWFSPNVLSLQDCSASATEIRPGDETTVSTTIDNPSYDPIAGDAVAFVGSTEVAIPFEVEPRGEASAEATFEVTGSEPVEYGFNLENVGHNY